MARLKHVVASMRTALVGQTTLRFDAIAVAGLVPIEHGVIESVRLRGHSVEIQWDDGVVLRTNMRFAGEWHVYHLHEKWHKPTYQAHVIIEVAQLVAVCFNSPEIEIYRSPDRKRHPQSGGAGPNISVARADLAGCTQRLLSYRDAEASIADALADQSIMTGLGNVHRSEILWAVGLSPFARIADLSYEDCSILVETAARIAGSMREITTNVYGRHGQPCTRCHGTIEFQVIGQQRRGLFWCPDCQDRLDRRLIPTDLVKDDHTPTHPAEILYMSDLRAARKRIRIDDDLGQLG